jgi:two-component system response regulator
MAESCARTDVLLVGADPELEDICRDALRTANPAHRVACAAAPDEGRDFLFCEGTHAGRNLDDQPRVIFLMLRAPAEDGIGFIRAVKSDERLKRTPIVVLSLLTGEDKLSECYRSGVNSYVSMREAPEQFRELIERIGRYWLMVNKSPC